MPPRIAFFRTDDLKGNCVVSLFVLALLLIFIWHVCLCLALFCVSLAVDIFLVDIHGQEFLFAFALCLFLCLIYS